MGRRSERRPVFSTAACRARLSASAAIARPRCRLRPKQTPTFDPHDERYWDPQDLAGELERVFSICHGCRMCVNYCPSFPDMFERVDGYVKLGRGEVDAFNAEDYKSVNDLCYQCKICYVKCPYTPDDGHP